MNTQTSDRSRRARTTQFLGGFFALALVATGLLLFVQTPALAEGAQTTQTTSSGVSSGSTSALSLKEAVQQAEQLAPLPKKYQNAQKGIKNSDGSTRSYQDFALCLAAKLDDAIKDYKAGNFDAAYANINKAYFDWYENNLEPPSMTLAGHRKTRMEGRFTRAKIALKTDPQSSELENRLTTIKVAVARDAMVLDGILKDSSPESAGLQLLKAAHPLGSNANSNHWVDFLTSFTLLLREGLEALLVVAAIILYLIRAGQKQVVRYVYFGAIAAILVSFGLAAVLKFLVGGASQASELFEGATMFFAVAVLFYVSNWMLSKSSNEQWGNYIQGIVRSHTPEPASTSDGNTATTGAVISRGACRALVFAAFLAVVREGAELVLFYTAAFSGGGVHNPLWIGAGFSLGVLCLAIIFVIFRFGGAKLPMRPIFIATSVLLFVMCISFVGKGVQELKEAGFILGATNLPWIPYYLPELGFYPQAETLLPQLILLVASVWILAHHLNKARHERKARAQAQVQAQATSSQLLDPQASAAHTELPNQ